jgi:hypothetical protein
MSSNDLNDNNQIDNTYTAKDSVEKDADSLTKKLRTIFHPWSNDVLVYIYIIISGMVLFGLTWQLGLYSDDYRNLHDAMTRNFGGYISHHLTHTNSRYAYALFHRILMALFYDEGDPFGWPFIRAVYIIGVLMHLTNCVLTYRILRHLDVNSHVVFLLLPLLVFPVFGKQAVLWIGAMMAHVLGLLAFLAAAVATINRHKLMLFVGIFIALGSSEFVLIPSALLVCIFAWREWQRQADLPRWTRVYKVLLATAPLLIPFAVYLAVILSSSGIHQRLKVLERYQRPRLWEMPMACLARYFGHYIPTLQPVDQFTKTPLLIAAILGILMVLAFSWKRAVKTGLFVFLTLSSILPLAAVGYFSTGTRLRYIVGFFFYSTFAVAFSSVLDRFWVLRWTRWTLLWRSLAIAGVLIITCFQIGRFIPFTDEGIEAYACIKEITEHIYDETSGKAPKRIELCGYPRKVGEFPIVNNWSLTRSLALKYHTKKRVRVKYVSKCKKERPPYFRTPSCPYEIWYKIYQ